MRKYIFNGLAALTMGLAMSSCMKEFTYEEQEQQASLNNAQQTLGFYIPDNQDWVMTNTVSANIPINIEDGETYTVKVYSNDPLMDAKGYVLAKETVANGQNFTTTFRAPSYKHAYSIGITNSKGGTMYRTAYLENGQLTEFVEDQPIEIDEEQVNASRTRAITVKGNTYDTFNFPTDEELAAAFPTEDDIPASALEIAELTGNLYFVYKDNSTGRNYKVTKPGSISIGGTWDNDKDKSKANNVYVNVDGDVTISRNGAEYINLYIINGNVTLDSNFGQCGGLISVAAGATLNDSRKELAHNGGIKLYNKGTVNATNSSEGYDINNNAAFYNEGTCNISGPMKYSAGAGNTSFFINMGDDAKLSAPSMTLNSTCHFYSGGTVNIAGETKVTQAGIVWINNGHYTTNTMVFSAKNGTFYNYCQLIVKDQCNFTDGLFNMMQGSYAEINRAVFNNFRVNMYNASGFNVKNGSKWGRQGADFIGTHQMQGFIASDDNARCFVRLAGETQVPAYTGYAFNVQGANLTLAYQSMKFYKGFNSIDLYSSYDNVSYWSETTAEQLAANQDGDKTWNLHNVTNIVTGSDFESVKAETKTGECSATWTTPSDPGIDEENNWWTYAFEDKITKCDFDMNDVVIQVKENEANKSELIVRLVAAGCEFDNYIWLDDELIKWANGAEVHEAFGADHGVMINTDRVKGVEKDPVETIIKKPEGFDFQNAKFKIRPFRIGTGPEDLTLSVTSDFIGIVKELEKNEKGVISQVPLGIAIPTIWKWPTEHTIVTTAYPTPDDNSHPGFASYGSEEDPIERNNQSSWYNYYIAKYVYSK